MYDVLVAFLAFGLAALCSLVSICVELFFEHVDSDSADPWRSAPRRGRPGIVIGAAAVPASGVISDEPAAFVPASGGAFDEPAAGDDDHRV